MEDKNHDYGEVWREMRKFSNWFDFELLRVKNKSKITKEKQLSQKVLTPLSGHDQLFHFCTDTNGFR
jgi:hypothetical protein